MRAGDDEGGKTEERRTGETNRTGSAAPRDEGVWGRSPQGAGGPRGAAPWAAGCPGGSAPPGIIYMYIV